MSPLPAAIVTGATGFVGLHLARALCAQGRDVHLLVRTHASADRLALLPPQAKRHVLDGSTEQLVSLFQTIPDGVVFHLASLFLASHTPADVEPLIRSNLLFGTQLLEAMTQSSVKQMVNAGTFWQHLDGSDEYHAVSLYAATKQAFEAITAFYAEAHALEIVHLKLPATYGPDDPRPKLFRLLAQHAASGEPLAMSPGLQRMNLLYVDDAVAAFLRADGLLRQAADTVVGRTFSVDPDDMPLLKDVVETYGRVVGKQVPVEWGARPYRDREVHVPWRGERLPGWRPQYDLESGIRRMLEAS